MNKKALLANWRSMKINYKSLRMERDDLKRLVSSCRRENRRLLMIIDIMNRELYDLRQNYANEKQRILDD